MSLGKVVITGGTGFVGSRLIKTLLPSASEVSVITRTPGAKALPLEVTQHSWDDDISSVVSGADVVVNLAGAPVVQRWTADGKESILSSRVSSTKALADAIEKLPESSAPRCVISASAIGYYGSWPNTCYDLTESSDSGGDSDFLVKVCKSWENAAAVITKSRLVTLRIGVVLAPGGGACERMLPIFNLGAGGPIGSGKQAVSWIHADDLVEMIISAAGDESISGVYNATAPQPSTMSEMSVALAGALGRPCLFPVPELALKVLYGDGASVVTQGQRVLPKRWTDSGFQFKYENIEDAMKAVATEYVSA